jgi:hypothetical protein
MDKADVKTTAGACFIGCKILRDILARLQIQLLAKSTRRVPPREGTSSARTDVENNKHENILRRNGDD